MNDEPIMHSYKLVITNDTILFRLVEEGNGDSMEMPLLLRLADEEEMIRFEDLAVAFTILDRPWETVLLGDLDGDIAPTIEERMAITLSHEALHRALSEHIGRLASKNLDRVVNANRRRSTPRGACASDGFSSIDLWCPKHGPSYDMPCVQCAWLRANRAAERTHLGDYL